MHTDKNVVATPSCDISRTLEGNAERQESFYNCAAADGNSQRSKDGDTHNDDDRQIDVMHEHTACSITSITGNGDQISDACETEHRACCPRDNYDCSSEKATEDVATRELAESETLIAHDSDCDAHHSSGSVDKQTVDAVPCCVQECDEFDDAHATENMD